MKQPFKLTPDMISAIEAAINREERIEIIPAKAENAKGARIMRVRRTEIRPDVGRP